jgi:hypothetical protein
MLGVETYQKSAFWPAWTTQNIILLFAMVNSNGAFQAHSVITPVPLFFVDR